MYTLDDTNTLRKQILDGIDEFPSQLGDTLLLEQAIKAMADEKQPIIVNVHNHPGEPPIVNMEPANIVVNVPEQKAPQIKVSVPEQPAPQVTVINKDSKAKAQEEFSKKARNAANGT